MTHYIDPWICSIHAWHGSSTGCPWCNLGINQPVAPSAPTNWIGTPEGVMVDANGRPITDPRFLLDTATVISRRIPSGDGGTDG